ncbi:DUF5776 domain-containing protein [Lentilactobacillus hilgardii]|nr:DUF5776 domain-containing protein [Lentilactobacillus hilgardii]MCV3739908.1 DUF5776 domain-containing protein [Lentilactobacillus hilgardii]
MTNKYLYGACTTTFAVLVGIGCIPSNAKAASSPVDNVRQTNVMTASSDATTDEIETGVWGTAPWTYNKTTKIMTLGDPDKTTQGADTFHINPHNFPGIFRKQLLDGCKSIEIIGKIQLAPYSYYLFSEGLLEDSYNDTLKTINGLTNLDTSKVTNMGGMFSGLGGLTTIDVSHFDTSNVTRMDDMFAGCQGLKTIDVSNFNTSNVTDMTRMFSSGGLTHIDVTNFDILNVGRMQDMFAGNEELTRLDLSSFDMKYLSFYSGMLSWCSNLSELILGKNTKAEDFWLKDHPTGTPIPNTNPQKYTTGNGWIAVTKDKGGTVDNPQGALYNNRFEGRPAETETYVWEQATTPVSKQDVLVQAIDADTQQPIAGTTTQKVSGYSGQPYTVIGDTYHPEIKGYTWDGKIPANATGNYGSESITVKYVYKKDAKPAEPGKPTTPTKPTTTAANPGSTGTSTSTNTASTSANNAGNSSSSITPANNSSSSSGQAPATTTKQPAMPKNVAAKGAVVYAIKKVGLYKTVNFTTNSRKAWYPKKPRLYRPMFVVTGYSHDANGKLRYQVRDVNHHSKRDGQTGYLTASRNYVRPVYYAAKTSQITVINPRGVNAYRKSNLSGKVKNYRQGTVLKVKQIVTHNLTTRYVLTNGQYVTANRKLVNMGRHKQVKSVKTKQAIQRYQDVNLTKTNQRLAANKRVKVYGFDYSHGQDLTKHGALRYRVAGGYITANTKYVRANY